MEEKINNVLSDQTSIKNLKEEIFNRLSEEELTIFKQFLKITEKMSIDDEWKFWCIIESLNKLSVK